MDYPAEIRYCFVRPSGIVSEGGTKMEKEIKKYTTVTFLCRGDLAHEVREMTTGMRLMDWLEEHVPVEPIRLLALIDQILILLRMRRDCVTACMYGIVCPQLFIVDHQDRVRLLDLTDESNSAVSRKIQSGSVTRFFAPYGMIDSADAQTEIYGVGRLCQYMLSENEEAGAVLTGPLRRRLEHFVDQCLGEGLRPFTDYERVCSQFDRIYDAGGREVPDQKRRAGAAAVKALYIAAAVFAAVLLLKKTVYDPQALDRMNVEDREQILSEVARLEQDIDQLQAEQRELRDLVQ